MSESFNKQYNIEELKSISLEEFKSLNDNCGIADKFEQLGNVFFVHNINQSVFTINGKLHSNFRKRHFKTFDKFLRTYDVNVIYVIKECKQLESGTIELTYIKNKDTNIIKKYMIESMLKNS